VTGPAPARSEWREFLAALRELAREMRADPQPLPVLYLRCDGCEQVTPRTSVRKHYIVTATATETALDGGTPESVCEVCDHGQIRVVGDEVPADTTIGCSGRRFRRFGIKRSRKPCGASFTVPAAAVLVVCPWCITTQPGPQNRS
jgi:hypothetical protein